MALSSDTRMLIAVRVVVVTTLLLAALIIQYTVGEVLPINYLYIAAGATYVLTLIYIALGVTIASRGLNVMIQIAGDLAVETLLVYFTGGLDSPFSFLYLVSIITASMLMYRRGGLLAASGAVILYGVLVDLLFYGILPLPAQSVPIDWSASRLYFNMAANFSGFYATALLTSYLSEQLQRTSLELDANRQNLAELRALNQNVVESIPSGLITLSSFGTASFVNPAGAAILQREPQAILGRHVTELGFFDFERWNAAREELAAGVVVRKEIDGVTVTGTSRSIGFAISPLSSLEGTAAGYTLIFQDLTEMKKLEAELRLKDRMAAVGELSAGIAHEIRNPLAAIAGSVQVLKGSKSLTQQEQRLMSIVLKESTSRSPTSSASSVRRKSARSSTTWPPVFPRRSISCRTLPSSTSVTRSAARSHLRRSPSSAMPIRSARCSGIWRATPCRPCPTEACSPCAPASMTMPTTSPSPTTAAGCLPPIWGASSSRSARTSPAAPVWGWPSRTASCRSTAAGST
jgi:two-component system sensor histidine kinase PilS (NtrC family)